MEILEGSCFYICSNLYDVTIPKSVKNIYRLAFGGTNSLKSIKILATSPPEMEGVEQSDGSILYNSFDTPSSSSFYLERIIVPKGCGNAYKTATGWSTYADYIVESE